MCPEQLFQRTLIELPSFYRNSYLQVNLSTCVGKGKKKKNLCNLDRLWHSLYHCWTISLGQRAFLLCHSTLLYQREFPHGVTHSLLLLTLITRSYQFYHSIEIFNLMKNLNAVFLRSLQMLFPLLICLSKSAPDISWNSGKHTLLLLLSWRLWALFAYYSPINGNAQFI